MDTRKKWALGALAVAAAVTALALLGSRPSPVRTVAVARGAITQSLVATGRIEASARIDLGSEVTATVREVRVREGDAVHAGQVLVRLSDDEARASLAQAEAALREARERAQEQGRVTAPVSEQAQAQANLRSAEREAERARALVAQGFYAPQRADDAERALATARSALRRPGSRRAPTNPARWLRGLRAPGWSRPSPPWRWRRRGWPNWPSSRRWMRACSPATPSPAPWPSPAACC
jgi:HlyD family secretion protein